MSENSNISEKQPKDIPRVGSEMSSLLRKVGVFGFIIVIGISGYAYVLSKDILAPLLLIGAAGFAPIGIILGALLFDKEMRCKIMRALTKKNLGIVNMIDGKNMYSRIANFDHDMLESRKGDKIYYLKKGKMYSQKGEAVGTIDQDSIKFTSGVPVIYFDTNSMLPLSFYEDTTTINAEQMSAIIQAHVIIQETKLMGRVKKTAAISIFVLIALIAVGIYYSFTTHSIAEQTYEYVLANLKTTNIVTQGV